MVPRSSSHAADAEIPRRRFTIDEYHRMGDAGRKHADMLFALSVTAGALGEDFRKVLQSSPPRVEAPG